MTSKCQPGDLAVVIDADIPGNLGAIVRVIETHDGSGPIRFDFEGKVWWVRCEHPMTWMSGGRTYSMKEGPVPDGRLQPIRGELPGTGQHANQQTRLREGIANST